MSAERQQVISAIKTLGRRVTVGDIAAGTGLPLLVAARQLNCVAADCRGTLQVTSEGNLVYSFAPAFETWYARSKALALLKAGWQKTAHAGFYLLRISFGVTLIASLITVVVLIVVALIAVLSKSNDSGGGGGGGGGGDLNLDWLDGLGQFFIWNLPAPMPDWSPAGPSTPNADELAYQAYQQGNYRMPGEAGPSKQGFILNCFSYLFGDGNPNSDIEQRKWRTIAEHIRTNGGVSTCEQLACYTGGNPRKEEDALPVLVRFDGHPAVTDNGNIIYVFPSMQVSTQQTQAARSAAAPVPHFLSELEWPFSNQPVEAFIPVAAFALLNFCGSMWLLHHVSTIAALHPYRYLIDWLSIYASFFLLFPLVRGVALVVVNAFITVNNSKRKQNFAYVQANSAGKLQEAKNYAVAVNTASAESIAYSTDRDALEQQFD